jgi:hypothetical protein
MHSAARSWASCAADCGVCGVLVCSSKLYFVAWIRGLLEAVVNSSNDWHGGGHL